MVSLIKKIGTKTPFWQILFSDSASQLCTILHNFHKVV